MDASDAICKCDPDTTTLIARGVQLDAVPACISRLIALEGLNLSNNKIAKIENLDALGKLEYLDLANNKIGKIEGLDALGNLKILYLDDNKIEKIENLDALGKLEYLGLKINKIPACECKAFKKSAAYKVYC